MKEKSPPRQHDIRIGVKLERERVIDVLMDTREDFRGGIKNGRDYDGWRLMIQGIEAGICNIVFGAGGHCPICKETHEKVEKI
jgi:hypothetical protein